MKYELIGTRFGSETKIDDDDNYSIKIIIDLHPTDNIADNFSKEITVISNNTQTGFEVDEQRQTAIADYLIQINTVSV